MERYTICRLGLLLLLLAISANIGASEMTNMFDDDPDIEETDALIPQNERHEDYTY